MKNKTVIRYLLFIVVGILMNLAFYNIAHIFHLPAWLDNVGTAFVAFALEPTAGLLVAFSSNFYEATFIYDVSSIIYYITSASFALCIGIGLRKHGKVCFKRMLPTMLVTFVVTTCIASILTIWRTGGMSDSHWELYFYEMAFAATSSPVLSCFFATGVLKFVDVGVLSILLPIFYFITPKQWINENNQDVVSWKNPYFNKKESDKS